MKKLLIILFFLISVFANAQTTYYIDPAGTDDAGEDGSAGEPWATLAYACTRVTTPGDIIHVNTGEYTETAIASVSAGVNIVGEGDGSHITYSYASSTWTNACIQLVSGSEATAGNQSISYLKIDGNATAYHGILVRCRTGVSLHHLTMVDFKYNAVHFNGKTTAFQFNNPPTNYSTGNKLYNCTITDCSNIAYNLNSTGHGQVRFTGQDGLEIYNNVFTQTGATAGSNANNIDATEGTNKGIKFYSNKSYKPEQNSTDWNFHWENWDCLGGHEVYDNTFSGGGQQLDIAGTYNVKGAYDYSWYVHDNIFTQDSQVAKGSKETIGIQCEGGVEDVIIAYNHISNLGNGIYFSIAQASREHDNIRVYYNILEDIGYTATNSWAIVITSSQATAVQNNIYIDNNVIECNLTYPTEAAIFFTPTGTCTDIYFRNNIVVNMSIVPLYVYYSDVGTLYSQNNCIYNSGSYEDHIRIVSGSVDSWTYSGVVEDDPDFVGGSPYDYSLQATSPCIDAGLNMGLTRDYSGNIVPSGDGVDIGAYEYGSFSTYPRIITSGGKLVTSGGDPVTVK